MDLLAKTWIHLFWRTQWAIDPHPQVQFGSSFYITTLKQGFLFLAKAQDLFRLLAPMV